MEARKSAEVSIDTVQLKSALLGRVVRVDFYLPANMDEDTDPVLLLINDGQDLVAMGFSKLLEQLYSVETISPMLCVGIHAGTDRVNEYGVSAITDHEGRGNKAGYYEQFILSELLPFISGRFHLYQLKQKAFAGFSLGGLSAMDIVWNNPDVFSKAGLFSGAFWWRLRDKNDKNYNQYTDRIMQNQVRKGQYAPNLKFFFQCGELDEMEDRNRNGVIDSIDDTIDLMRELVAKGYREGKNIFYLQMPDGKHEVLSWGKAMPVFLKWGWGTVHD